MSDLLDMAKNISGGHGKKPITKKCPMCGKSRTLYVDAHSYELWMKGAKVQGAFSNLDAFDREFLITGTCLDCQEKIFNKPAPGHEDRFGELIGNCPTCDCAIWTKDAISEDTYKCPSCHTHVNSNCEEI